MNTDTELFAWEETILEGKEQTVQAAIAELGAMLIGRDPLPVEHHWQSLYPHTFWRGGPVINSAIAGLDQALWDLQGKGMGGACGIGC